MAKPVEVQFSTTAYADFLELQKQVSIEQGQGKKSSFNMQLLKAICREMQNLKANPWMGDHIPRQVISKNVFARYKTDRLWRVELVGYWRLIYTVSGDSIKIVDVVLKFMDHKTYDKVFGYKKK